MLEDLTGADEMGVRLGRGWMAVMNEEMPARGPLASGRAETDKASRAAERMAVGCIVDV